MATAKPAAKVTGQPETDYAGRVIYSVPSRSNPGDVYQVVETDGVCECACKAFTYRGTCAHLAAVSDYKVRHSAAYRDSAPVYRSNKPFSIWAS
jgi:hypothetical protein